MATIGEFTLQADENGLITLQCERCNTRFKVESEYLNNELIGDIFCPNCGIPSSISDLYPEEVQKQAIAIAKVEAMKMVQDAFSGLNSKYIKVTNTRIPKVDTHRVFTDKDFDMQVIETKCCRKQVGIKNIDTVAGYYCPYCGRIEK